MSALTLSDSYNRDQIEDAFQRWRVAPDSVDVTWQAFFAGATFAGSGVADKLAATAPPIPGDLRLQTGVVRLVNWYRQVGHIQAHIDPLQDAPPAAVRPVQARELRPHLRRPRKDRRRQHGLRPGRPHDSAQTP